MNDTTKALAEKMGRGKGLNADDRELLASLATGDSKEWSAFMALQQEIGTKASKTTMELVHGTGRYTGLYFKFTTPEAKNPVNAGLPKLRHLKAFLDAVSIETLEAAYKAGKECVWIVDNDKNVRLMSDGKPAHNVAK
jgi:hypothetical protein